MENIISALINLVILFFAPFIILGIIRKTKAFWGGRKGAPILQPFWDFIKLLRKNRVVSNSTSWVFNFAPIAIIVSTIFAGLFAPLMFGYSIINIEMAFVIFAYLFGFGKFFSLISAMDTASSFEGMGASREACFTTIIEPAFFIILASVTVLTTNFNFNSISNIINSSGNYGILIIITAVIALLIMLLTECSRIPVDDPTTHLELTMIHEVMILDNSGIDLALITWASGIKMVILMGLIANFIIPSSLDFLSKGILFISIGILLAIIIGTIESAIARLRMSHVFEFIFVMSSLALVIASLVTVKLYGV